MRSEVQMNIKRLMDIGFIADCVTVKACRSAGSGRGRIRVPGKASARQLQGRRKC